MGRGLPAEKIFNENIDRLISGQETRDVSETDQDLKSALDFARLMKLRRPQPAPQFKANLKARLLQTLAQQEIEAKPNWFQRLIPRQLVWQAVSAVVIVLVISGVVLGIILRNESTAPVVEAPEKTPALTTTAPATTTAATTTAAPSATLPSGIQGVLINAEAGTDKSTYAPGEKVVIEVKLKNSGAQPLLLAQFPPILSLMSAAGSPILSFQSGQSGRTLAVGETVSFYQVWNQTDAKGRAVPAGVYYLELEDIDMQGQAYRLNLSQPVSFKITP